MAGIKWTQEEVDLLLLGTEKGWTAKEIGIELGRSPASVAIKRGQLKVLSPSYRARKVYTREELIVALKNSPNSSFSYCKFADNGLPPMNAYTREFGSWSAACLAADIVNECVQKIDKETILYIIKFEDFYKVGITQQTLRQRFGRGYPHYTVIKTVSTTLEEAKFLEKCILNSVAKYKFTPSTFPKEGRGGTECFKCTEVELNTIILLTLSRSEYLSCS